MLRNAIADLHHAQPPMVVQGTVFEIVYPQVSNLQVPNAARYEFGEDTIALPKRNFRFADIVYPGYFSPVDSAHYRWSDEPPGHATGTPDMSRLEAQLKFYCCARRQLEAGCEAVHFGQVMLMDKQEPRHRGWWSILERVLAYPTTHNRGFILCDAHTHGEYYDPAPEHPALDSSRQLLFDFHSLPLRATEIDTAYTGMRGAILKIPAVPSRDGAIFRQRKGEISPSGHPQRRLSALVELNNWGACGRPGKPGQWPCIWGVDEISWFAPQPTAYCDQ